MHKKDLVRMHRLLSLLNAAMVMPRAAKRLVILVCDLTVLSAALILAVWLKPGIAQPVVMLSWSVTAAAAVGVVGHGGSWQGAATENFQRLCLSGHDGRVSGDAGSGAKMLW
jgi:hypothetical protein